MLVIMSDKRTDDTSWNWKYSFLCSSRVPHLHCILPDYHCMVHHKQPEDDTISWPTCHPMNALGVAVLIPLMSDPTLMYIGSLTELTSTFNLNCAINNPTCALPSVICTLYPLHLLSSSLQSWRKSKILRKKYCACEISWFCLGSPLYRYGDILHCFLGK